MTLLATFSFPHRGVPVVGAWVLALATASRAVGLTLTTIDVPGAVSTTNWDVNPRGDIVGFYTDTSSTPHGFLFEGGSFTTVDVPGAIGTIAFGTNSRGDIVGTYFDTGGKDHGFLFERGSFTTIDFPGASSTEAVGINSRGDIGGFYRDTTGTHGFLFQNGAFTTIDVPSAAGLGTAANGINPRGDIVGTYRILSASSTAFCYKGRVSPPSMCRARPAPARGTTAASTFRSSPCRFRLKRMISVGPSVAGTEGAPRRRRDLLPRRTRTRSDQVTDDVAQAIASSRAALVTRSPSFTGWNV